MTSKILKAFVTDPWKYTKYAFYIFILCVSVASLSAYTFLNSMSNNCDPTPDVNVGVILDTIPMGRDFCVMWIQTPSMIKVEGEIYVGNEEPVEINMPFPSVCTDVELGKCLFANKCPAKFYVSECGDTLTSLE